MPDQQTENSFWPVNFGQVYLTETVFCLKSSLNLLILKILQVELLSSWCWFNDVILQDTAHSGYMQSLSTTSNMDRQLSRQKSVKKSQWWKHKRWCFYDLQDKKWIKMPKQKKILDTPVFMFSLLRIFIWDFWRNNWQSMHIWRSKKTALFTLTIYFIDPSWKLHI